jgi:hypothetical protein
VPPGRDVVVMASGLGATEAAIVMGRFAVAERGEFVLESLTVIATDDVPTELCTGVPEIEPVELLIDNPPGRPLAL